jgi:isoquinoline 1-oxidoreductase
VVVNHQTQNKIGYGELTKGKQLLLPISDEAPITPASDWKVAGKTVPKANGRSFITGNHKYVSDMKLPGMLYGKVLRPPAYEAKLINVNLSAAQAMPDVVVVHEGDFIGVAAPDERIADKAIKAITAHWETTKQPSRSEIFSYLRKNAEGESSDENAGSTISDVENGIASAELTLNSTYNINYIAHVPLETRAALAQWEEGKLTVWTGTQRPFGVQEDLAEAFKIPKERCG